MIIEFGCIAQYQESNMKRISQSQMDNLCRGGGIKEGEHGID